MSYDVYVEVPTGPSHRIEAFWQNYTSNCSFMWAEALDIPDQPWLDEHGRQRVGKRQIDGEWVDVPLTNWGLGALDGAPCSEAAAVLWRGVERMRAMEADFRRREPENGWGNYEGALAFLTAIAQAATDHPLGFIRVSR